MLKQSEWIAFVTKCHIVVANLEATVSTKIDLLLSNFHLWLPGVIVCAFIQLLTALTLWDLADPVNASIHMYGDTAVAFRCL